MPGPAAVWDKMSSVSGTLWQGGGDGEEENAGLRVSNGRVEMAETIKGNGRTMGSCMPLGFFFLFVYAMVTPPPWWDCMCMCA